MRLALLIIIVFFIFSGIFGYELIINKMAFFPDTVNFLPKKRLAQGVQEVFIETEDQVKLQCYFIASKSSGSILIYFHGNAGNIDGRLPDLLKINSFGINVLGVGYRGYGRSQGSPSEHGIYKDGQAALNYARQTLGFTTDNIIILGRSIGSTVAVNTAQHLNISGLILVTPLTSGKEFAKSSGLGFIAFMAGNVFNNIDKASNIVCPTLVIHGTDDEVIPFEMGQRLFAAVPSQKRFVQIPGGSHNDLSSVFATTYWPPISQFIKDRTSP